MIDLWFLQEDQQELQLHESFVLEWTDNLV